jgi:cupin 2 domain-containing protein
MMDDLRRGRLGDYAGEKPDHEIFTPLVSGRDFELEEIASYGAASPEGFWYNQDRDEWVLLAKGEATLRFEEGESIELKAGDHLIIPAGKRHRVESTSLDAVWVALHFRS